MTKLLASLAAFTALTAAASAADLPRRAAPPPVFTPVPVFTWTGAYFGINAGFADGHVDVHRWKEPDTLKPIRHGFGRTGSEDHQWVADHATVAIPRPSR